MSGRTKAYTGVILAGGILVTLMLGHWIANRRAAARSPHEQRIACDELPTGRRRPEYGCFNVAHVENLSFPDTVIWWSLHRFPSRSAAESARSPQGFVWEEDGVIWLSELGTTESRPAGGSFVARIGPLQLPRATEYTASYAYAVMRPGQRSRVHIHPGPEAWYVLAGEQCLETSVGTFKGGAGEPVVAPANVPMELTVTGTETRRALVLVVHDGREPQAKPVEWQPRGACVTG